MKDLTEQDIHDLMDSLYLDAKPKMDLKKSPIMQIGGAGLLSMSDETFKSIWGLPGLEVFSSIDDYEKIMQRGKDLGLNSLKNR
jgi:hypothetical protein